ncbi:MAG TPA: SCP2 sterol-binding domain-containing protein, partial [Thermoplasmata archaeon]|nr:SCP2 sterol-binding domain-containing protein [Thermoplasmata archaeon]
MDKTISLVNEKVEMFNQLYNSSEKLQKHLSGLERIIHIQLEDAGSFYLTFGKEGLSKAVTGEPEQEAHITIISTTETLNNVLTGKEKKMKAIVTKK